MLTIDDVEAPVALPGLVLDALCRRLRMKHDGAGVVLLFRCEELEVVDEFLEVDVLPRVAPLVVRHPQDPLAEDLLYRQHVVHRTTPVTGTPPRILGRTDRSFPARVCGAAAHGSRSIVGLVPE